MTDSPKMKDAGFLRLKKRVARLQTLLEADAPSSVIAWECRLIADAGKMVDPEAYFRRDREDWIRVQRFKMGLCEDCDETVAQPTHALDAPPLEQSHCAAHLREILDDPDLTDDDEGLS